MADHTEELVDLRRRVETLEGLVTALRGQVADLEAAGGGPHSDFHMADQEQTV